MDPEEENKPAQKTDEKPVVTKTTENPVIQTTQAEVIPDPKKPKTEGIDVSQLNQEDPNIIHVAWDDDPNKPFTGQTKPVSEPPKPPGGGTSPINPVSTSSFNVGIKVLVEVVDFIMSNVLWKVAGEGKAASYAADVTSKNNLKDALVMIFEENKMNIPTWLVVLFAFLAAYGFQIMGAINIRKNKQSEKNPNNKAPLEPGVFETDGKLYRRYANGAVHERKFNMDGTEKIIGQPPKFSRRKAA